LIVFFFSLPLQRLWAELQYTSDARHVDPTTTSTNHPTTEYYYWSDSLQHPVRSTTDTESTPFVSFIRLDANHHHHHHHEAMDGVVVVVVIPIISSHHLLLNTNGFSSTTTDFS
jgi:hypothetical protein